jgi:hypothetical protein
MSLSHLAITETPALDTWNQTRSVEHLSGFLSRLNEKAFSDTSEELELDFEF